MASPIVFKYLDIVLDKPYQAKAFGRSRLAKYISQLWISTILSIEELQIAIAQVRTLRALSFYGTNSDEILVTSGGHTFENFNHGRIPIYYWRERYEIIDPGAHQSSLRDLGPFLSQLQYLEHLDLDGQLKVGDLKALGPALSNLVHLRSLGLSNNTFGAEDLRVIPSHIRSLELHSISMAQNSLTHLTLCQVLLDLSEITFLDLSNLISHIGIKDHLLSALAGMISLQSLDLTATLRALGIPIGDFVPVLTNLANLRSLDLSHNPHNKPEDMEALSNALSTLPELTSFRYDDPNIKARQELIAILDGM